MALSSPIYITVYSVPWPNTALKCSSTLALRLAKLEGIADNIIKTEFYSVGYPTKVSVFLACWSQTVPSLFYLPWLR